MSFIKVSQFWQISISLLLLIVFLSSTAFPSDSITRHGITWTFDKIYTTGTYSNGDYWVVGPVTITSISPQPTVGRNGTVINPSIGREQGFDDRVSAYNTYTHSLNIGTDLPLVVQPQSSVVSSISKEVTTNHEQIKTYAILTVVTSPPPEGSFRPGPIGGDYSHPWQESKLDYGKLPNMSRSLVNAPSLSETANIFANTWFEKDLTWTGRYLHPNYMGNQNGYGKGMAIMTGDAILLLCLDYSIAQKRDLLVNFVQYGIDIHGLIAAGGRWNADGGHNPGRLAPAMVSAITLGDSTLLENLSSTEMNFQELQQTFFVSQSDIETVHSGPNPPYLGYEPQHLGMPEWGIRHYSNPTTDNRYWSSAYRDIAGGVLLAPAIAAKLMGLQETINHDPFFSYAERHIYYRLDRYTDPEFYNGYDDGDAYGSGATESTSPFSNNDIPAFHKDFYTIFETFTLSTKPPNSPSNLDFTAN